MRRVAFIVACLMLSLGLHAQEKTVVLHRNGQVLYQTPVSNIGGIGFLSNPASIVFSNQQGTTLNTIPISEIDSVTFGTYEIPSGDQVVITFNGSTAEVVNPFANDGVSVETSQGNVTVYSTKTDVPYLVTGSSTNGSLTVYSNSDFAMTLSHLTLTSTTTAAIHLASNVPTLKIVNPDFHGTKGYGWKYASTSMPLFIDEGGINCGHFYMETFDMWQTIHGLEPGRYEVRVSAFHRPDSGHWTMWHYEHASDQEDGRAYSTAELYADTASVRLLNWAVEANSEPLPDDRMFFEEHVKDEIPNAIRAAGYYFNHGHYINMLEFTVPEGTDSVRIGIRLPVMRENSLSWVVFDRFRIRKL